MRTNSTPLSVGSAPVSNHMVSSLDLLVVEAHPTFAHSLEGALEISLCEATAGLRVGFAFIDVDNPDEYPGISGIARFAYWRSHQYRVAKVRAAEHILAERGVLIIPVEEVSVSGVPSVNTSELSSPELLRRWTVDGANLGLGVLSSLINMTRDINPDLDRHRSLTTRLLEASLTVHARVRELIARYQPARAR